MDKVTQTIHAPYDGSVVGEMPVSDEGAVENSVKRALASYQVMRRLPRFVRADILNRAAQILDRRRDAVIDTIVREAGKPLYDARGEVSRAIFNLSNAAAEARQFAGSEIPLDVDSAVFEYQSTKSDGKALSIDDVDYAELNRLRRRFGIARRFPVGPILAITPFNFPLNLVVHKVGPALAVGNSVVVKPAPQTPLTSLQLLDILREAGLPEGAMQVVHCSVPLAERMVRDDRFAMVTFTGSAQVGWHIKSIAGRKKVSLELGGNAAVIVTADADLGYAAARCVRGGVGYGGQYCIGVQRSYVHRSRFGQFREELVERVSAVKVGEPLKEGTDVGAGSVLIAVQVVP